jgi:hypothetical protein
MSRTDVRIKAGRHDLPGVALKASGREKRDGTLRRTRLGVGLLCVGGLILLLVFILVDNRPSWGELLVDLAIGLGVIGGLQFILNRVIEERERRDAEVLNRIRAMTADVEKKLAEIREETAATKDFLQNHEMKMTLNEIHYKMDMAALEVDQIRRKVDPEYAVEAKERDKELAETKLPEVREAVRRREEAAEQGAGEDS